jgi:3-isopropylmalate dehydrogenase
MKPIGGSASKYTGKNVINPFAAICTGGMMLDILGEKKAADRIEKGLLQLCKMT